MHCDCMTSAGRPLAIGGATRGLQAGRGRAPGGRPPSVVTANKLAIDTHDPDIVTN